MTRSEKRRESRRVETLRCPKCGAVSVPYIIEKKDMTEEERDAVFCASCKVNMTPIIREMKKLIEEAKEKIKEDE